MLRHAWILVAASTACATLEPPPADFTGEVQLAEESLYFETFEASEAAGATPETVVLVHGGGVDRRIWDAQIDALVEHHRVVRYDRRGYGLSSSPGQPYSDTADLVALLDQLGVERAHVVASSAGADVAVELALEHPQRVRSLALVGPTLNGHRYSGHETQLVDAIFRTAQTSGAEAAIESWVAKPGMFASDDLAERGPNKLRELLNENRQVFTFPWNLRERAERTVPLLSQVQLPTLVVVGREDTPDNRVLADLLADRLPNCSLVILNEAGHMAHLEQPAKFNDRLLSFLRKHRERDER